MSNFILQIFYSKRNGAEMLLALNWLRIKPQNRFKIRFSADWRTNSEACGAQLTANQGLIQSPNYPANYPNNAECSWKISVSHANDNDHIEAVFFVD